mgnify:CR=1 FL=1
MRDYKCYHVLRRRSRANESLRLIEIASRHGLRRWLLAGHDLRLDVEQLEDTDRSLLDRGREDRIVEHMSLESLLVQVRQLGQRLLRVLLELLADRLSNRTVD